MSTEILISSDPWENRVAILEDGALSEIYVEREEKVIGSIYKGKVQNVLPGMGASFVDIGLGRNAFLYVDDINKTPLNIGDVEITQGRSGWTIGEKVNRGDDVLVQIVKEPRGLKGARISTNVSLPGRYLVLMPTGKYSGVSRKVESAEERDRLKSVMKRIRPEGMATVVRTAASGVSEAELIADLGVLIRMWHGILEMYKRAQAPALLHKDMNLVYKAARDFITADVDKVLIDDAAEYEKVRDFLRLLGPQYLDRLEHYDSGRNLFKDYKVDEELDKLMRPKINLPSGGSIVIESTEALTVIDVNSGKFTGGRNLEDTIVRTNVEAAAEIARQVRLRDIGGIIVCDFIDMSTEDSRNKVIATLEAGLRRDRTRATIQSFSALGLLEFTRKRVGKDLWGQLRGHCPTCTGLGTVLSSESVAIDTLRRVRATGPNHGHPIVVEAAPTVGAQLEYWYQDECKALGKELERPIHVRVDALLHPEKTRLRTLADEQQALAPIEHRPVRVGDEREVDLLTTRLPNPASALAVIEGRLVEVENAANFAGQTMRVRVLDVDSDTALAEPIGGTVEKKRRTRGGRAAAVTPQQQAQQLRALAKEAAASSADRASIGISTEAEAKIEEELDKKTAIVAPREAPAEGEGRRRRRRRGGRGRRHEEPAASGIPQESLQAQAAPPAAPAPAGDERVVPFPAPGEDGLRRRRRRRRRGGRTAHAAPAASVAPLPDRHVVRVHPGGQAQPTGETLPAPPSRAIAPWNRKPAAVAVEAPPPHLKAVETEPQVTRPARRSRRTAASAAPVALQNDTQVALPSTKAPRRRKASEDAAPAKARSTSVAKGRKKSAGTAKRLSSEDKVEKKPRKSRKTTA